MSIDWSIPDRAGPAWEASNPADAPPPTEAERREQALARVRSLLLDLGTSDEEIDEAVKDDVVDLLVVDRMLIPAERRMTQRELAESTGMSEDLVQRLWRALGFIDVPDDERTFTEMDVEAVELFQVMVGMGIADVDTALQLARVIGASMARIADAEVAPGTTPIIVPSGDSVIDADEFARLASTSLPAMGRLLEFAWRRHVQAATRRAMLIRTRGTVEGVSPTLAVGFADMVGYTVLSQHIEEAQLAAVVSRFEELAYDTVTSLGGRVVKMIGDEVMFVVESATAAADIGLSLSEAYADDELLSDVRVGLAIGPVLIQDGDFYGPVVNLASRVVNIANPGTVLVSDEFHAQLEVETADGDGSGGGQAFVSKALRPRNLKHLGRVQVWNLSRAGRRVPSSERRGVMRWERLAGVVREPDDRRTRAVGRSPDKGRSPGNGPGQPTTRSLPGMMPDRGGATRSQPTVMGALAIRALAIRALAIRGQPSVIRTVAIP
ncbi:MAG TPA: adenylate cyclase regulatory domain-containing protein [Acidimicrobiales bacterium]